MNGTPSELRPDKPLLYRRALAYVADAVLLGGPILFAVTRMTRSRVRRAVLAGVLGSVLGTLYHLFLEGRYGQTPGKRLLGIVVVREDGTPCTYAASTVRTVLRFVDWLPAAYLLGIASIALTERHQRVGDLVAGTIVVRAAEARDGTES